MLHRFMLFSHDNNKWSKTSFNVSAKEYIWSKFKTVAACIYMDYRNVSVLLQEKLCGQWLAAILYNA